MRYRRADTTGATYFFTVNLAEHKRDLLVRHIDALAPVGSADAAKSSRHIRDDVDLQAWVDYVHFNRVRQGTR